MIILKAIKTRWNKILKQDGYFERVVSFYSECRLKSDGALKHVLGCCTFDHVTSIITMEQICLKLYALIWGELILVPKGWSSI